MQRILHHLWQDVALVIIVLEAYDGCNSLIQRSWGMGSLMVGSVGLGRRGGGGSRGGGLTELAPQEHG